MPRKSRTAVEGQVIEQGDIFFFQRPAGDQGPGAEADMESLFLVLHPLDEKVYREIVFGRGRLPGLTGPRKQWGLVYRVLENPGEVRHVLGPQRYSGGGEDHIRPPAEPVGEGVYVLVKHRDHTHLVYALERDPGREEIRRVLGIEDEASYIIAVKNPETADSSFHPELRRRLAIRFRGRRWVPVDPVDFLDVESVELVLIPGRKQPSPGEPPESGEEARYREEIVRELKEDRQGLPVASLLEEDEAWA